MNKPALSFWQIWNMSFGFLGIQFGWGLQMANMSPIYKYLGAEDSQIPMLWMAAGLLWILDASINVSMEPFRAFVADKLPEQQRATGFAMQSFLIGIGAVIAGMLPYILKNWFHVSSDT